jgi:hypothetical protein
MSAVDVPLRFEFLTVIGVVVDLTVVGNKKRTILVRHRLMTSLNVNNTQTTVAKAHVLIDVHSLIVGPAMGDDITHAPQQRRVNLSL